jgi:hypothetical protein
VATSTPWTILRSLRPRNHGTQYSIYRGTSTNPKSPSKEKRLHVLQHTALHLRTFCWRRISFIYLYYCRRVERGRANMLQGEAAPLCINSRTHPSAAILQRYTDYTFHCVKLSYTRTSNVSTFCQDCQWCNCESEILRMHLQDEDMDCPMRFRTFKLHICAGRPDIHTDSIDRAE